MTMMPSFVPGYLAMMLRTGNFPSGVSAVNGIALDFVALQVRKNIVFEFFVIRTADWAGSEGDDFFHVLHGAVRVDGRGGRGTVRRFAGWSIAWRRRRRVCFNGRR